ncbi:MaoC family dehydratase [Halomarina halobia]|uniref:MaoC family dehydratase n=1 Tax=Halomarina halobia TaxID=3033386 RepID=A0ABD6AF93_9EURY|nr:MaoC/PaaZ C-terminal domain-containing protein [Halomarina sp. PSR21]
MIEQRVYESFEIGEKYVTHGRTVTDSDIRAFIGATGSTDPIHIDREYAATHPLVDDVVAQGTLLLGIADGFFVDAVATDAALAMNYGHDRVRYLGAVSPGDSVHATVEITGKARRDEDWGLITANVELINQNDETVLTDTHRLLVASEENGAL